jgi:hypothetical protein
MTAFIQINYQIRKCVQMKLKKKKKLFQGARKNVGWGLPEINLIFLFP